MGEENTLISLNLQLHIHYRNRVWIKSPDSSNFCGCEQNVPSSAPLLVSSPERSLLGMGVPATQ